ncbi:MAG: DNA-directed RNA polymerase subunit beta', partial [Clostridia bacterium]
NGRRSKPVTGASNRELKSLSDMLKGKQGRFRQNLLGKRVDYSGRSVIVVGPELKMYQCGLPKAMALELFKPFVMRKLVELGHCQNIKSSKRMIEQGKNVVWDILENVIKDHPVLLNRAPTLHRLGIQAFEPVLVEGKAIKLHPLACGAFNADFDGDQMAVHIPLSIEAQAEARILMLATNNILKLSDGRPVVSPTQDMVIGCYYLTIDKEGAKGEGRVFKDDEEALMAYQLKEIELQTAIKVRRQRVIDGVLYSKRLDTTVGRIIFNTAIPQDIHLTERNVPEDQLDLEVNYLVDKKQLSKIVDVCFKYKGATETATMLDNVKRLGYKYSTIGAITASVFDMTLPPAKKVIVKETEAKALEIEKQFRRGRMTEQGRYQQTIKIWQEAKERVDKELVGGLGKFNPIWMMAHSGARGNMSQISQLCGMRGLVRDPSGKIVELPVKSCYREGLSVLEYFISSHGGRKGLADTALKTAESGYLTRRLVNVSQDVIINEPDCGDTKGFVVKAIKNIENLGDRVEGRYSMDDIVNPKTGEIIVKKDTMITKDQAYEIDQSGLESVKIRSILTCKAKHGVCAKCYGKNMASSNPVKLGEAVGIIAAQSIGEPGTQLTMRTFHTGGVAVSEDITQGLPRVEELFEARNPKGVATISDIAGKVKIDEESRIVSVIGAEETKNYKVYAAKLLVKNDDMIEPGIPLTVGSINPQDILRTRGVAGVQDYLIKEVQSAYRSSGVEICDKHIEVIVHQMLRKVRIESQGSTKMLPGELVDIFTYEEENERTLEKGGEPATAKRTLLGITKASLATESFLSAASFQETAKVLTEAAIKNKVDYLRGLNENVLLGKLIPAGTGMKMYNKIYITTANEEKNVVVESNEHIDNISGDILGDLE